MRELLWRNVITGSEDAMRDFPLRDVGSITHDDGDGDDEGKNQRRDGDVLRYIVSRAATEKSRKGNVRRT